MLNLPPLTTNYTNLFEDLIHLKDLTNNIKYVMQILQRK